MTDFSTTGPLVTVFHAVKCSDNQNLRDCLLKHFVHLVFEV